MTPTPTVLTPRDAARELRVSLTKIYQLLAAGKIPGVAPFRPIRIDRERFDEWRKSWGKR